MYGLSDPVNYLNFYGVFRYGLPIFWIDFRAMDRFRRFDEAYYQRFYEDPKTRVTSTDDHAAATGRMKIVINHFHLAFREPINTSNRIQRVTGLVENPCAGDHLVRLHLGFGVVTSGGVIG